MPATHNQLNHRNYDMPTWEWERIVVTNGLEILQQLRCWREMGAEILGKEFKFSLTNPDHSLDVIAAKLRSGTEFGLEVRVEGNLIIVKVKELETITEEI